MNSGQHAGAPPTANLDAERAVLGSIVLDNAAYPRAAQIIVPDDFSHDRHRRIFRKMMALASTGRPIDPVLLTAELFRSGELDAIGGVIYLSALTEDLPRSINVAHYARVVKDKALLRRTVETLHRRLAQAQEPSADPQELLPAICADFTALRQVTSSLAFRTAAEIAAEGALPLEWVAFPWVAAETIAQCKRTGARLMVVDTLGQFARLAGDAENNAGDAVEAVELGARFLRLWRHRRYDPDASTPGRQDPFHAARYPVAVALR